MLVKFGLELFVDCPIHAHTPLIQGTEDKGDGLLTQRLNVLLQDLEFINVISCTLLSDICEQIFPTPCTGNDIDS